MILADEGLNGNLVRALREDGYEITWIKETKPGIEDEDIISLAMQTSQILITEDKDFGEWIFAHHLSGLTIIFLRYDKEDYSRILSFLKTELKTMESGEKNEFITINKNKVRRRRI
nr:toxin-antitoxin system, toxin component [Cytophagales bacterium]